jgi:hypothetical protein
VSRCDQLYVQTYISRGAYLSEWPFFLTHALLELLSPKSSARERPVSGCTAKLQLGEELQDNGAQDPLHFSCPGDGIIFMPFMSAP